MVRKRPVPGLERTGRRSRFHGADAECRGADGWGERSDDDDVHDHAGAASARGSRAAWPREGIDCDEVDIEQVEGAAELVDEVNGGNRTVPTVVFDDGTALTNPSVKQVKEKLAA